MVAPGVVGRGGVGEVEVPILPSAFDVVVARVEDADRYLDEDEGGERDGDDDDDGDEGEDS